MEVADDACGGSASSPVVLAPPQYCVVGGTDGLIGGVFIAKTTAVAGIALCVVGGTDGLIGGVLVVIGIFSVVRYYVRSDVDGKGRKRLWQVGNW